MFRVEGLGCTVACSPVRESRMERSPALATRNLGGAVRLVIAFLREGGSRGVCNPKVPLCSPLLPKAPEASLRFPRYLPPLEPPSLKNPFI